MNTQNPSRKTSSEDRFIPVRETHQNTHDLHQYSSLTQRSDELIKDALINDPSLGVMTDINSNVQKLSQLVMTQHKRTSFLIEKMMPQQRKLFRFSKKNLRPKPVPLGLENDAQLRRRVKRTDRFPIRRKPIKILEAPGLLDDYYLNLVVWSKSNIIGVGLEDCVYFYLYSKNKVVKHFDCSDLSNNSKGALSMGSWPYICSMSFNTAGDSLAVADSSGNLRLMDVQTNQVVTQAKTHDARIGSVHWQYNYLVSGSRDSFVNLYDVRKSLRRPVHSFMGHHQEICGLKLSPDNQFIASGGNDNKCILWSLRMMKVH